jgi:Rod binding domain-containing protein
MSTGISGAPEPAGLPVVNQALEPSWVRDGSASTKKAYALAQDFEGMLVQELSQSMASTSGLDGGEESSMTGESGEGGEAPVAGAGAMPSELSSMLPQALSAGMMSAGGLGLAAQLTRGLQPTASPPAQVGASGGTGA